MHPNDVKLLYNIFLIEFDVTYLPVGVAALSNTIKSIYCYNMKDKYTYHK